MAWTCDAQPAKAVLAQADIFRGRRGRHPRAHGTVAVGRIPLWASHLRRGRIVRPRIVSGEVKIALRSPDGRVKLLNPHGAGGRVRGAGCLPKTTTE